MAGGGRTGRSGAADVKGDTGDRRGCRSTAQDFIERLMVPEAQAGRCVVRLKGGDPFVFGRGGEERAFLMAAAIEVEAVNGISSGPLTHRDWSSGAIFVTGHERQDQHDTCDTSDRRPGGLGAGQPEHYRRGGRGALR